MLVFPIELSFKNQNRAMFRTLNPYLRYKEQKKINHGHALKLYLVSYKFDSPQVKKNLMSNKTNFIYELRTSFQ